MKHPSFEPMKFSPHILCAFLLSFSPAQAAILSLTGTGTVVNSPTGNTSNANVLVGDSLLFTGMGTDPITGLSYDAIVTVNGLGASTILDAAPASAPIHLVGSADPDMWADLSLDFIAAGSSTTANPLGTALAVPFLTNVTAQDIDSISGRNYSDVFGLFNPPNPVALGADLENGGFLNTVGQPTAGVDYARLRDDLAGSSTDWVNEGNANTMDPDNYATWNYNDASSSGIRFVWGVTSDGTGDQTIGGDGRGMLAFFEIPDEIPNEFPVIPEPSRAVLLALGLFAIFSRRSRG